MSIASRAILLTMIGLLLSTCTDPVVPVFQFETGFILVEGRITDTPGYSEIRVSRSELLFDNYTLSPELGATVSSISSDGEEVSWEQVGGSSAFRAPEGWVAEAGKSYSLRIITSQGEMVESEPEQLPTSVPMQNVRVEFEQEAYFSTGRNRFIPAFTLLVDVDDPPGEDNFYQYRYTTYEMIDVCASCERSRWRDGVCIAGPGTNFVSRWDYLCDAACWVFSNSQDLNILSDEFSQGQRIEGIPAGRFDYSRPGGLLFDVQQYSTSAAAFAFNSTLKELADGSSGLNAPLPAALIGNLSDLSEKGTPVLGFVSVSSVSTERVYINRESFGGTSLPYDSQIILEPVMPTPPVAPCEGTNRSRIEPEGWGG